MLSKKISLFLKFLLWGSPLLFWLGWQIILVYPNSLWILALATVALLLPALFELGGRVFDRRFAFSLIATSLLLGSFYLFISLLANNIVVQILWLIMIWHLYRYLFASRKYIVSGDINDWAQMSLYAGLVTIFLASASLFGLQAFLSLSPWPLLGVLTLVLLANTSSLAYSQGWYVKENMWLWPWLSLMVAEIAMMISFLPLNYLISGILSTLAYYSAINFVRLYLTKKLSGRRIKNYALFTVISLAVILLTARWL